MSENNVKSTTMLPAALRPAPDESGMTVPQLLEHRIHVLFEHIPLVAELGEAFAQTGHDLYLVGGSVRDALMGRLGHDLDFTTDARPDDTEAILRQRTHATWDIGRAFGTIGAQINDWVVEVTTYRADAYHPDSRKPEIVYGETLEDDLIRRDFTVNAMALHAATRTFSDPYAGLADIVAGVLRTPFPPERSFSDDPLRMMRAARFSSQLGFDVAPEAFRAMREMAASIEMISAERVRDELVKLLMSPTPRRGLELLVESGIAEHVLPELPALALEIDEHHRHKDVYEHSLIVLEQAMALEGPREVPGVEAPTEVEGPDLVLRLAALLHDIGKPDTRRFEPGGGVSFHHHELVGAKMTRKRLRALRFDKETIKQVSRLVELHLRFHGYGNGEWTDSAVRRYVTDAGPLLPRLHLLTRADSTTRNKRKAARLQATYDDLEARIERLQAEEELAAVRPELDGNEIQAVLGIKPGPVLGRAYKHLLAVRLDEGVIGKDAASERLREWWAQQPESQG